MFLNTLIFEAMYTSKNVVDMIEVSTVVKVKADAMVFLYTDTRVGLLDVHAHKPMLECMTTGQIHQVDVQLN